MKERWNWREENVKSDMRERRTRGKEEIWGEGGKKWEKEGERRMGRKRRREGSEEIKRQRGRDTVDGGGGNCNMSSEWRKRVKSRGEDW